MNKKDLTPESKDSPAWLHDSHRHLLFISKFQEKSIIDNISRLIEFISYHYRNDAFSILRLPIKTEHRLSLQAYCALKVCAKRHRIAMLKEEKKSQFENTPKNRFITQINCHKTLRPRAQFQGLPVHALLSETERIRVQLQRLVGSNLSISDAATLLDQATSLLPESRYSSIPRVGALLIDVKGKVLRVAFNQPTLAPIWHAEWLVIAEHFAELNQNPAHPIFLISTRKPCRMCASLAWQLIVEKYIEHVFYLHEDKGPMAAQTALNAQSFDRNYAKKISNPCLLSEINFESECETKLQCAHSFSESL